MEFEKQKELEIKKLAIDFCNRFGVNDLFLILSIKDLLNTGISLDEIKSGSYDLEILRKQRSYLKSKEKRIEEYQYFKKR